MRKWMLIVMVPLVLVLGGTSTVRADDTDLYVAGIDTVEPNCLIIFDNSGSMNEKMPAMPYDPNQTYPNVLGVDPKAVYYRSWTSWDNIYRNTVGEILCDDPRQALSTYGFFNGSLRNSSECGSWRRGYLRTGNYLKFWLSETLAIDGAVAWSFADDEDVQLHSDVLYHKFDMFNVKEGKLPIYFGVGARIKFVVDNDEDNKFGIRFPVGIDYIFAEAPLDIFFELVPILEVAPSNKFGFNGGVGIRYFFR